MANVKVNGSITANGANMSAGKIANVGTPTAAGDAATKGYVDNAVSGITPGESYLPTAGGTMTGAIAMGGNKVTGMGTPTDTGDAATKGYVDNAVSGITPGESYLPTAGGTMTGAIAMGGNKVTGMGTPTDTGDAATKGYVDSAIAEVEDNPTFTGNIDLSGGTVTNVPNPTNGTDAANKNYVDNSISNVNTEITNIKELVEYPNATATYGSGVVAITGPADAGMIIFNAPSAWVESDTYTYNGSAITLTDMEGNALSAGWANGAPVMFLLKGNQAFFKSGGGGGGGTYPVDGEIHVAVADSLENLPQGSYLYTIGCITSTQPSNITIQCEPPASPANGDIFIDIGSLKPTEKGIPLGNGLVKATVYVLNAYQWNGTEWAIIKTYLRQESGWVDCATEIFTYGEINQEFTGGLTARGSAKINPIESDPYIQIPGDLQSFFYPNKMVNFNNFNKLYIIANVNSTNTTTRIAHFANTSIVTIDKATYIGSVQYNKITEGLGEIDTSIVTTTDYLFIGGNGQTYAEALLLRVYLI